MSRFFSNWRYHYGRPKNSPLTPEDLTNFMKHTIHIWNQIQKSGMYAELMWLRDKKVALDWLNFFISLGAKVRFGAEEEAEVWWVEATLDEKSKKQLYYALQSFAIDVIFAVNKLVQRCFNEPEEKDKTRVMVTLNPVLGDIFNCYGFGLINPKNGNVYITLPKKNYWSTDYRRSGLVKYLNKWAEIFRDGLEQMTREDIEKELLEQDKAMLAAEEHVKKCKVLNEKCIYKPLVETDWCDIPEKYVLGPLSKQQCFDLNEILRHMEAQLNAKKYGNPYPQVPSDPFNREPFTQEELESFWETARMVDVRHKYPKLDRYISALQLGQMPTPSADGYWEDQSMRKVIEVLYG